MAREISSSSVFPKYLLMPLHESADSLLYRERQNGRSSTLPAVALAAKWDPLKTFGGE